MDSSTKRLFTATIVSLIVLLGWARLTNYLYPPPPKPPAATQPEIEFAESGSTQPASIGTGVAASAPATSKAGYSVVSADKAQVFELGAAATSFVQPTIKSPTNYWLNLQLTTRGAAIKTAELTAREYRYTVARTRDAPADPYPLLAPFVSPADGRELLAFETTALRLIDEHRDVQLDDVEWFGRSEVGSDEKGHETSRAIFETTINHDGAPCLRLRKTYSLPRGSFDLDVRLEVENLTDQPVRYTLHQAGPVGIHRDAPLGGDSAGRGEDRFVLAGVSDNNGGVKAVPYQHTSIPKDETRSLDLGEKLKWVAHTNKWFIAIVSPEATTDADHAPMELLKASADAMTADTDLTDDMHLMLKIGPAVTNKEGKQTAVPLPAHQTAAIDLDTYLGPRDHNRFTQNPTYAARGYDNILSATGGSCTFLTFSPLIAVMRWLLNAVHTVLPVPGSYGWAIIVMVLIVRLLLHGLTKRGQLGMMRLQKKTAALQPKLEALKLRYADDPTTLNKETMTLYREAGINPLAQMSSCLLMFIQMPIWIALWTTLNTSIELRHQPFILWMRDLSGPDALIPFSQSYTIPVIGMMVGPIHSFNVLPLVMGITMYLQQKLTQKLTQAAKPAVVSTPSPDGKPSAADQMKQQQKMMSFMTIFFALMFYNSPCGLNLYIFTSNIFGMLEQWHIRKHITAGEVEGNTGVIPGPGVGPDPKGPGWWSRMQKRLEDLQKNAEQGRLSSEPPAPRKTRREQGRRR